MSFQISQKAIVLSLNSLLVHKFIGLRNPHSSKVNNLWDISETRTEGSRVRGIINVAYGSEDEGRKQRDSQEAIALARPHRQSCTPGIPDSLFDLTPNVPRIQSIGKGSKGRL